MNPGPSVALGLHSVMLWICNVAIPLAGVALLSMALIQTAKNMFPLRRWFQSSHVERWLKNRDAKGANLPAAKKDLVHVTTAGDAKALYALPIEQLCGQINAATQVILDYPERHSNLLQCLASESDPNDVALVNSPPVARAAIRTLMREKPDDLTPNQRDQIDEFVAARNRISHQMQRAVDSLQISIGFRWKFWMQLIAILLSAALAAAGLAVSGHPLTSLRAIGYIILAAIFSGFLAPVTRDLVAAVEQLRT
jgi:hypothetical protein